MIYWRTDVSLTSSLKLFKILYYIKQIDSKLPCVCSVIDHRGRQNVVRTAVTHSAAPHVPLFCSYYILTSSMIYYWTDTWQLVIYLLNRPTVTWNLLVISDLSLYNVIVFHSCFQKIVNAFFEFKSWFYQSK